MKGTPPLLEVEDLSVRFGGLVANDGVSLTVGERELVGLVGPNGAGKTTLFNAVCGLVDPAGGRVRFGGRDVTTWPPHRRAAAGMARTFQRLELFRHMTVLENLMLPHEVLFSGAGLWADLFVLPAKRRAERQAREQAQEVAALLGLERYLQRRAGELPLGLGRLVELGRALASRPRLLLLDEPTSGMDTAETAGLAEVLHEVARSRGVGVLLVEHDLPFVTAVCDRVYVLDFGRLIASGTPREVQRHPAVREAYLGDRHAAARA